MQHQKLSYDRLIRSIADRLDVPPDVRKSSSFVAKHAFTESDSTSSKVVVAGSNPPPGTYGLVRTAPITSTTLTRTRSLKLANLKHADLTAVLELVAGGTLTTADFLSQPHPILIAAGLLVMICAFTRLVTIEFSEREASVFWGLIHSCDDKKIARFDGILVSTNEIRHQAGLPPLSPSELRLALGVLQRLKTVTPLKAEPDAWRVRESWSKRSTTFSGA